MSKKLFGEAFADEIYKYKDNKQELLEKIKKVFKDSNVDFPKNGKKEPDFIDPFSAIGIFQKTKKVNRDNLLRNLKEEFNIDFNFENELPHYSQINKYFTEDDENNVNKVWDIFENALNYSKDQKNKIALIKSINEVQNVKYVKKNITICLFWIRPDFYISLDGNVVNYFNDKKFNYNFINDKIVDGEKYLNFIEEIKRNIKEDKFEFKSFLELSYLTNPYKRKKDIKINKRLNESNNILIENDFLDDIFLTSEECYNIKCLIERKKNVIIQGAPGVGKTFVSKKMVYSLIGNKDDDKIKLIQFHQNYTYEDFIMGYRPKSDGDGFELKYGPFFDFCMKAKNDSNNNYYFIIDEINRGNTSKIFGEIFMLVENDKRTEEYKIPLMYSNGNVSDEKEKYANEFYVPKNIYIIGLMNTADRSIAMIDYALRRRFAFYTLEPAFENKKFKKYIKNSIVEKIAEEVNKLNKDIEQDKNLGKGFKIGHSYFCDKNHNPKEIINYELMPLIEEFYYDNFDKVKEIRKKFEELLEITESQNLKSNE